MNQTATDTLEPAAPDVKRYHRLKLISGIISTILGFAWLVLFALWLGPIVGHWLDSWTHSAWLQLLAVAFLLGAGAEVLGLPFDFWSGFVLEHRFQLSNQTFAKWLWKRIKLYFVAAILGLPLLAGLYALLWYTGPYWWLWAAVGYLLVAIIMGRIMPVLILPLFYKVTRFDNPEMQQRLERIAAGTGLAVEGIYRLHLSEETKKANAALAGMGRTRRVLLGDTLLDEFTPEEIEVVFAHEVGHHVYRHLPKMIVVSVVLALTGFFLVDQVLARFALALGYDGMTDAAALGLVLLVLGVLGFLLTPAENALSRFFERQCDRYALDRTRNPIAYKSAFAKLARQNKADPDPNPLVVWLFYDHPPIRQRIQMADH